MPAKAKPAAKRSRNAAPARAYSNAAVEEIERHHRLEAAYLKGFTDPSKAARGPGGYSRHPTNLATMYGYQDLSFTANATPANHYDDNTNNIQYSVNSSGDVALVVRPTPYIVSGSSADANGTVAMGFAWDPSNALNDFVFGAYGTDPGTGVRKCPLEQFSTGLPGGFKFIHDNEFLSRVPFRTVGLKATITINQPALDCQGHVYAFDNMDTYVRASHTGTSVLDVALATKTEGAVGATSTTGHIVHQGEEGLEPRSYRRATSCGAFRNGKSYEVCFLPAHDSILEFSHSYLGARFADNANIPYGGVDDLLVSSPAVMFVFKGLNTTNSLPLITLTTQWVMEFGVDLLGPTSWSMPMARYIDRFVPDWSHLQSIPTAGDIGSVAIRFSGTAPGALAKAMEAKVVPKPQTQKPRIPGPPKKDDSEARELERATTGAAITAGVMKYGPKAKGFLGKLGGFLKNALVKSARSAERQAVELIEDAPARVVELA